MRVFDWTVMVRPFFLDRVSLWHQHNSDRLNWLGICWAVWVILLVGTCAISSTGRAAAVQGIWTFGPSMRTARTHMVAVILGESIYAAGGENRTQLALRVLEVYSLRNRRWVTKTPMPTGRFETAGAAGPDGRIYVIGGRSAKDAVLNVVEAYDPRTNRWYRRAALHTARAGLAVVKGADGRIYAIGGDGGAGTRNAALRSVEAYDPSRNAWSSVAPLPFGRRNLAAVAAPNGKIYAMGGQDATGNVYSTVMVYTPRSNAWTTVAPMPTARYFLGAAASPNGFLYAVDGNDSAGRYMTTVEQFQIATNTWTVLASTQQARHGPGVVWGSDERLYVIGGEDTIHGQREFLRTVEVGYPMLPARTSRPTGAGLHVMPSTTAFAEHCHRTESQLIGCKY